jgi:hypothetical protein
VAIEVRSVGSEAFEEIHPLLARFPTPQMSKEDWRWTLFRSAWSDNPCHGFALYADGRAVGFIGTIFSTRHLLGRMEPICSLSSWIVLEEHRNASLLLLRPILALRDYTLVNLTPSPAVYEIFSKLGFKPLESERLLLSPVPRLAEAARAVSGSATLSPEVLRDELSGEERTIYQDLSGSPVARHVLLRHGERKCYLVATPMRKKGIPFAEIQYIGDREFFWDNRLLAHAALFRSIGALGLMVDSRFRRGSRPPLSVRWPSRRLYRPTRDEIAPELIDGLYSEMMGLRW